MAYRILLVGTDKELAALLKAVRDPVGYEFESAHTGSEALTKIDAQRPDLVVLEISLADIDGLVWLKLLRETRVGKDLPVIVASRTHAEEGMAQAFELGADDFVCFHLLDPRELSARLRAVLRRRFERVEELGGPILLGSLELDPLRHLCRVRGREKKLRPREFELLEILMRKAGRVLSRPYLLESVWGMSSTADTRAVDVTVGRLRKALGKRVGARIETIERFGYRFKN